MFRDELNVISDNRLLLLIQTDSVPDLHALRRATPTESDITIAKVMDAVKQKFASGVEVTEMVNNIMPLLVLIMNEILWSSHNTKLCQSFVVRVISK